MKIIQLRKVLLWKQDIPIPAMSLKGGTAGLQSESLIKYISVPRLCASRKDHSYKHFPCSEENLNFWDKFLSV